LKIAVITPYYKEPISYLKECHESVLAQKVKADHFFIADGHPNDQLNNWDIKHILLPLSHSDNGNTPRGIGSILASSEGYDFIAYLDADNWFHPNHLLSLTDLFNNTGADICASFRSIHSLDGKELPDIQDSDERDFLHIDTSCYLLHKSAFDLVDIWLKMPKILSPLCDRVFFQGVIKKRYKIASTKQKTCAFRTQYRAHYQLANLVPPPNAKDAVGQECYEYLSKIEGLRESVDKLGFIPL
jgi:glycosyltransferase involved in cell wall biosynthesis